MVDDTFATPSFPSEHARRYRGAFGYEIIGGHGTSLGGVIVDRVRSIGRRQGRHDAIAEPNPSYHGVSFVDSRALRLSSPMSRAILLRDTGASISPFNAFLLLQRHRDAFAASRTPRGKRQEDGRIPCCTPAGRQGQPSCPSRPSRPCAV